MRRNIYFLSRAFSIASLVQEANGFLQVRTHAHALRRPLPHVLPPHAGERAAQHHEALGPLRHAAQKGGDGGGQHALLQIGHQLGLHHGGRKPLNGIPIYPSLMNYAYNYQLGGKRGSTDFSRGHLAGLSLDERALAERVPVYARRLRSRWFDIGSLESFEAAKRQGVDAWTRQRRRIDASRLQHIDAPMRRRVEASMYGGVDASTC